MQVPFDTSMMNSCFCTDLQSFRDREFKHGGLRLYFTPNDHIGITNFPKYYTESRVFAVVPWGDNGPLDVVYFQAVVNFALNRRDLHIVLIASTVSETYPGALVRPENLPEFTQLILESEAVNGWATVDWILYPKEHNGEVIRQRMEPKLSCPCISIIDSDVSSQVPAYNIRNQAGKPDHLSTELGPPGPVWCPVEETADVVAVRNKEVSSKSSRDVTCRRPDLCFKASCAWQDLKAFSSTENLPTILPCARDHYRLRCKLCIGRRTSPTGNQELYMYKYDNKEEVEVTHYSLATVAINRLLPRFIAGLNQSDKVLRNGLTVVTFLNTMDGDMIITMVYNDEGNVGSDAWLASAKEMRLAHGFANVGITGRSRGVKIEVDPGRVFVRERLYLVDGTELEYNQVDGSFSHPNGRINEMSLDWLTSQAIKVKHHIGSIHNHNETDEKLPISSNTINGDVKEPTLDSDGQAIDSDSGATNSAADGQKKAFDSEATNSAADGQKKAFDSEATKITSDGQKKDFDSEATNSTSHGQIKSTDSQATNSTSHGQIKGTDSQATNSTSDGQGKTSSSGVTTTDTSNLLELYCGGGNHTVAIVKQKLFDRVVAVEIDSNLVEAANANLTLNRCDGAQSKVFRIPSGSFCKRLVRKPVFQGSHFDCALVDPPRCGLDSVTMAALKQFKVVWYISCDYHALVQNMAELQSHFVIHDMAVFDGFPSTAHVEVAVCLLSRGLSNQ